MVIENNAVVLFDMDGTLLDTEKIYQKYWRRAAKEMGYPLTTEQALRFRSMGRPAVEELSLEIFGDREAYLKIRKRRKELMDPYMRLAEVPKKPYVEETLAALRERGCKLAVVTATDLPKTEEYLSRAGLINCFDRLISTAMVANGKPYPDVYLYACMEMGVEPKDAYAVEDAPNGIKAAYGAGCKVIMIPDLSEPDEEIADMLYFKGETIHDILGE